MSVAKPNQPNPRSPEANQINRLINHSQNLISSTKQRLISPGQGMGIDKMSSSQNKGKLNAMHTVAHFESQPPQTQNKNQMVVMTQHPQFIKNMLNGKLSESAG